MTSPWLSIPLEDYEAHMSSAGVQQLPALAELFKYALERCVPESLAVLGVAGGNGLEHVDSAVTRRLVAVDINPIYLDTVQSDLAPNQGWSCVVAIFLVPTFLSSRWRSYTRR
jgi:hypothetical protein